MERPEEADVAYLEKTLDREAKKLGLAGGVARLPVAAGGGARLAVRLG